MEHTFDRVAAVYDRTRALPPEVEIAIGAGIADLTAATAATRFLEVGVGTGRIALPLVRQGYCYYGVDLSMPMLRAADQKAQGLAGRLILCDADACALPFASATFDVAIVVHLFHLIPAWPEAFAEVLRVIRPGGAFLYGAEQQGAVDEPDPFAARWKAALATHGIVPRNHRATDEGVLAALRQRGLNPEHHTIANWTRTSTVEQTLTRYASRDYSSSWSIPEPIFREANATLAAWAREHYPDGAFPLTTAATFTVLSVRC
ncbi:MAG TPA: class I SAM-dependent methyltransferase [Thermomicrobiales bacterium]|jgi:ubiquinone/menaquinone biosynthesis C-methylase UbiE